MNKPTLFGATRLGVQSRPVRLFIAADADTASGVSQAVATSGFEVVGTATSGRDCLDKVGSCGCDILLAAASLPDVPGVKMAELVSVSHPEMATVILGSESDGELMGEAMIAGARGIVPSPYSAHELDGALKRIFEIDRQRKLKSHGWQAHSKRAAGDKNGRMVVVCSGKGGVGKSFVSANLSVIASRSSADKKLALVDMDLACGDIGILLDLEKSKGLGDLLSVASELDGELLRAAARHYSDNLDCYLAPASVANIDADSVEPLVASLSREYDLLIVNTGPPSCWPTAELMSLADLVLMVTTPDLASLKACTRLREAHEDIGVVLSKLNVVVNQRMENDALSDKRLSKLLGLPVVGSLPFEAGSVRDLVNRGVPLSAKRNGSLYEAMEYVREKTLVRTGLV